MKNRVEALQITMPAYDKLAFFFAHWQLKLIGTLLERRLKNKHKTH